MEKITLSEEMEQLADSVIKQYPKDLSWLTEKDIQIAYVSSDKDKEKDGRAVFGNAGKRMLQLRRSQDSTLLSRFMRIISIIFQTNKREFLCTMNFYMQA